MRRLRTYRFRYDVWSIDGKVSFPLAVEHFSQPSAERKADHVFRSDYWQGKRIEWNKTRRHLEDVR